MPRSSSDAHKSCEQEDPFGLPSSDLDQRFPTFADASGRGVTDSRHRTSNVYSTINQSATSRPSYLVQQHHFHQTNYFAQRQSDLSTRPHTPYTPNAQPSSIVPGAPSPLTTPAEGDGDGHGPIDWPRRRSTLRPEASQSFTSVLRATASGVYPQDSIIPRISGRRRGTQLMLRATLENFVEPIPSQQSSTRTITQQPVLAVDFVNMSTLAHEHLQSGLQSLDQSSTHSREVPNASRPAVSPSLDSRGMGNNRARSADGAHSAPGAQSTPGQQMLAMSPAQLTLLLQQTREFTAFMQFAQRRDAAARPPTQAGSSHPLLETPTNQDDRGSPHGHQRNGQTAVPSTPIVPSQPNRVSALGPAFASGSGSHTTGPTATSRKRLPEADVPKVKRRRKCETTDYGGARTPLERARAVLTLGLGGRNKPNCDPTRPIRCRLAPIPGCMPDESGLCGYQCADSGELVEHVLAPMHPMADQRPGHGIGGSKGSKAATAVRKPGDVGMCTWGDVRGCTFRQAQGAMGGAGKAKGKARDEDEDGPLTDEMVVGNIARHIATVHAGLTRDQLIVIRQALKLTRTERDDLKSRSSSSATPNISSDEGDGSVFGGFANNAMANIPGMSMSNQHLPHGRDNAVDEYSGAASCQDQYTAPFTFLSIDNSTTDGELMPTPASLNDPLALSSTNAADMFYIFHNPCSNAYNVDPDLQSMHPAANNLNHHEGSRFQAPSYPHPDTSAFPSFIDDRAFNFDIDFNFGTHTVNDHTHTNQDPITSNEFTLGLEWSTNDVQPGPHGIWGWGWEVTPNELENQQDVNPPAPSQAGAGGSASNIDQSLFDEYSTLGQHDGTPAGSAHASNPYLGDQAQNAEEDPWGGLEYVD